MQLEDAKGEKSMPTEGHYLESAGEQGTREAAALLGDTSEGGSGQAAGCDEEAPIALLRPLGGGRSPTEERGKSEECGVGTERSGPKVAAAWSPPGSHEEGRCWGLR